MTLPASYRNHDTANLRKAQTSTTAHHQKPPQPLWTQIHTQPKQAPSTSAKIQTPRIYLQPHNRAPLSAHTTNHHRTPRNPDLHPPPKPNPPTSARNLNHKSRYDASTS
ncbi:hypothetical protein AAZX31_13G106300 [Glycine max]|nr:hypothetical protein GmHk_13G037410 [Glycine max]